MAADSIDDALIRRIPAMTILDYKDIFKVLGQEARLRVFYYIYQSGPKGVRPKEMIEELGMNTGTLDFHLKKLASVNLISVKRAGISSTYCPVRSFPPQLITSLKECYGKWGKATGSSGFDG